MATNPFLPRRNCSNPSCLTKTFQPRRRDQLFCSLACKDHFHNSRKRDINTIIYHLEKVLRLNESKLARIYANPLFPTHIVDEQFIAYEGVVIHCSTNQNINKDSGNVIMWSHRYGIEYLGNLPRKYRIHKR